MCEFHEDPWSHVCIQVAPKPSLMAADRFALACKPNALSNSEWLEVVCICWHRFLQVPPCLSNSGSGHWKLLISMELYVYSTEIFILYVYNIFCAHHLWHKINHRL